MNYQETVNYLYECTPVFEHVGASAYKEGLDNTYALDKHFGHPHQHYKIIHIAGTNVKVLVLIRLLLYCKLWDMMSDYIHLRIW